MPRILYAKAGITKIEEVIGMNVPYTNILDATSVLYEDQPHTGIICGNWFHIKDKVCAVCMSHDFYHLAPAIPYMWGRTGEAATNMGNIMFIRVERYDEDDWLKDETGVLDLTDDDLQIVYESIRKARELAESRRYRS